MKIKNNVKCLRLLPSFYFITLAKVFFHLLTSLPFSYFPKLRTVIGMLLNRNVIKQHFFFAVFFFLPFFPFFTILKSNAKSPCIPLFSFRKESQHCSAINQRDPFMVSYF